MPTLTSTVALVLLFCAIIYDNGLLDHAALIKSVSFYVYLLQRTVTSLILTVNSVSTLRVTLTLDWGTRMRLRSCWNVKRDTIWILLMMKTCSHVKKEVGQQQDLPPSVDLHVKVSIERQKWCRKWDLKKNPKIYACAIPLVRDRRQLLHLVHLQIPTSWCCKRVQHQKKMYWICTEQIFQVKFLSNEGTILSFSFRFKAKQPNHHNLKVLCDLIQNSQRFTKLKYFYVYVQWQASPVHQR